MILRLDVVEVKRFDVFGLHKCDVFAQRHVIVLVYNFEFELDFQYFVYFVITDRNNVGGVYGVAVHGVYDFSFSLNP